jgi:hypothetical protein
MRQVTINDTELEAALKGVPDANICELLRMHVRASDNLIPPRNAPNNVPPNNVPPNNVPPNNVPPNNVPPNNVPPNNVPPNYEETEKRMLARVVEVLSSTTVVAKSDPEALTPLFFELGHLKSSVSSLGTTVSSLGTTFSSLESIQRDLATFVGKTKTSAKGALAESGLVAYLTQHLHDAVVEAVASSRQVGRMDLRVSRNDRSTILIDSKQLSQGRALRNQDVDKFYADQRLADANAILVVFSGFVRGKRRFHVERVGERFVVVLSHVETGDYASVMRACEVIWCLEDASQQSGDAKKYVTDEVLAALAHQIDALENLVAKQKSYLDHATECNRAMAATQLRSILSAIQ